MIIECNSCSRKFIVKDRDIPKEGRTVQCGHCSAEWFQSPVRKKRSKRRSEKDTKLKLGTKTIDPSLGQISGETTDEEEYSQHTYKNKQGIGFFGYIVLLIIIALSIIGVLKTFEDELQTYFPDVGYIFETLDNMLVIVKDLVKSY